MPQDAIEQYKSDMGFKLLSEGKVIDRFKTTFIAPDHYNFIASINN